jgi:NTP pyrophosphatase (non-canonical NTP hydrolase)
MDKLISDVEQWGLDKGILPNPDASAQALKTCEEVEELIQAILDDNREEAIDAIGDIVVTLIMQTYAWDITLQECVKTAYDTISQRTGKMVNGQFVKDKVH